MTITSRIGNIPNVHGLQFTFALTFKLFQNIHPFPLILTALTSQLLWDTLPAYEVCVLGEGPATAPLAPRKLGDLWAQNTKDTIGNRELASQHSPLCSTHETLACPSSGHFSRGMLLERTSSKMQCWARTLQFCSVPKLPVAGLLSQSDK